MLVTKPDDPRATPGAHVVEEENGPHKLHSDLHPDNKVYMDTHKMNKSFLFICFVLLGI